MHAFRARKVDLDFLKIFTNQIAELRRTMRKCIALKRANPNIFITLLIRVVDSTEKMHPSLWDANLPFRKEEAS